MKLNIVKLVDSLPPCFVDVLLKPAPTLPLSLPWNQRPPSESTYDFNSAETLPKRVGVPKDDRIRPLSVLTSGRFIRLVHPVAMFGPPWNLLDNVFRNEIADAAQTHVRSRFKGSLGYSMG